jgi:cell division protein FtsB
MKKVKPSKQYRMMVVPYRPYRKLIFALLLLLFFVTAVAGSFFAGRYIVVGGQTNVVDELEAVREDNANKAAEIEEFQQKIANLRLATEVDRKANEEIRAEVVSLKTQLAELEQDNSFYRSLMRPAPGDKGLVLDAPAISKSDAENQFKYNLVIKQIVTKHSQVTGYLLFDLIGNQAGESKRLALKDISKNYRTERIKLSFKYFQRIEGVMDLPESFVPERIELKVVTERPSKAVIDKKFGWATKES